MTHCSDDELVLHYYGETVDAADHLGACGACAARLAELRTILAAVAAVEPPARDERYGLEVWQRIRYRLPDPEPWWRLFGVRTAWLAGAAAALVLVVGGFAAGRLWSPAPIDLATAAVVVHDESARKRVLLLTVADHLDRSGRVLTDIVNAPEGIDISAEQLWAEDLLAASRLYRQDALDTDERAVAAVLDELERALLEVIHRPAQATAEDLDEIRRRVDSAALLFKVRVLSNELRDREQAAPATFPTSSIG